MMGQGARSRGGVVACAAGLGCAAAVWAGAWDVETWDSGGTAGWTNGSTEVVLWNPGDHLQMRYPSQAIPGYGDDVALGPVGQPVRMTGMMFRFKAQTRPPSRLCAYFRSPVSGRRWQLDLPLPEAGAWQSYSVPMDFSAGWFKGAEGSVAEFLEDLSAVDQVGVYVRRHGSTAEQAFGLDDFTVEGFALVSGDSDGDGMPDEWEETHKLNILDPADAFIDADEDGLANYAEYVSGTDPRDPDSVFVVDIQKLAEPPERVVVGVVLRWQSMSNRVYSVWKTHDVKGAAFVPLATGIVADPPVNEYRDTRATNAVRGFYRVKVLE